MSSLVTPADDFCTGHPLGYNDLVCSIRTSKHSSQQELLPSQKPEHSEHPVLGSPGFEDNKCVLWRGVVAGMVLMNRRKPYKLQAFSLPRATGRFVCEDQVLGHRP